MKIFLGAPYYHPNGLIRRERSKKVDAWALRLMQMGHTIFSPLTHTVPLERLMVKKDQPGAEFWLAQSLPHIPWADEVWILGLEGWDESNGVEKELTEAIRKAKPIFFLDPFKENLKEIVFGREKLVLRGERPLPVGSDGAREMVEDFYGVLTGRWGD